jgi:UDP-N-acetylmuramate dehydrogenase
MENFITHLGQYAKVDENVAFSSMTTMGVGGNARYVVYPKNELALLEIIQLAAHNDIPYKILGKGSNILASDDDYAGLVIRLDRTFTDVFFEGDLCVAQGGASLIALSYKAMQNGLSGLEFACGIPGTIAGAVYMNAGAYHGRIGDLVQEVQVLIDGKVVWIPGYECCWDYRGSIFQRHHDWIILAVRLKLAPKDKDEIRELIEKRRTRRIETQPLDYPNAGSIFRNPPDHFAWEFIEACQLRGLCIGGAMVSHKHANFIINVDHAKAIDVARLIDKVKAEVKRKFDVELQTEIEFFNWRKTE